MKGKIKAISTSKIRKIIAIRKNWIENGKRLTFVGSNPHSNGEFFSLSEKVFLDSTLINRIITITIIAAIVLSVTINKIIYTISRFFDWKSNIIFILYKYLPHQ